MVSQDCASPFLLYSLFSFLLFATNKKNNQMSHRQQIELKAKLPSDRRKWKSIALIKWRKKKVIITNNKKHVGALFVWLYVQGGRRVMEWRIDQ
jgi:hypothetical protein